MKFATWLGWTPVMVISAFILALVSPAAAQDTKSERATLAGLTGVYVLVEAMTPDAERDGLARSTLQTDVELKLRQAGIRVLSENEFTEVPRSPMLYLRVSTFRRSELSVSAFHIKLEVAQVVRLVRDPTITLPAATWEINRLGLVGSDKLSKVRENVRDAVDQFINAYLAANPKR